MVKHLRKSSKKKLYSLVHSLYVDKAIFPETRALYTKLVLMNAKFHIYLVETDSIGKI